MSHFAATIVVMEEKPRTTPYPLRMTDELRSKLEAAAKSGSRSLHAEIVARLERSFTAEKEVEQTAFESGFEASMLREEVARLTKLLESQKAEAQKFLQEQSKAMAAEVLKHLYSEAGETIEAARQAAAELKAAGRWPLPKP